MKHPEMTSHWPDPLVPVSCTPSCLLEVGGMRNLRSLVVSTIRCSHVDKLDTLRGDIFYAGLHPLQHRKVYDKIIIMST